MAAEDVVSTPEIGRALHHRYGGGLLHHAHQCRITPRIATDATGLILGQVSAFLTGANPFGHGGQNRGKPFDLFRGLLEQMESEPLCRLSADPREFRELGNQLLDCAHRSERGCEWQRRYLAHLCL
jgi:hypothetical protein